MLEQEKKNLEIINAGNRSNGQDVARAETNIRKLEEELKYVCGEVNTIFNYFFLHFINEEKLIINLTSTLIYFIIFCLLFFNHTQKKT